MPSVTAKKNAGGDQTHRRRRHGDRNPDDNSTLALFPNQTQANTRAPQSAIALAGPVVDEYRLNELANALAFLQESRRRRKLIEEMVAVELLMLMHAAGIERVRTATSEVSPMPISLVVCNEHGIDPAECGCATKPSFASRAIVGSSMLYARRRKRS